MVFVQGLVEVKNIPGKIINDTSDTRKGKQKIQAIIPFHAVYTEMLTGSYIDNLSYKFIFLEQLKYNIFI